MMNEKPIIVISSSQVNTEKTVLALNLSAALWADGYKVLLFAPENKQVEQFMKQRQQLADLCHCKLVMPKIFTDFAQITDSLDDKSVIIADIPADKNAQYAEVFAQAHTLISVVSSDTENKPFSAEYLNLIWDTKKRAAARGIKYLNWVVLTYTHSGNYEGANQKEITQNAVRYGYRIYSLLYRNAFTNIKSGYCPADMRLHKLPMKMALSDVYARHDILKLTDFLWQSK